jgi:hypothetical protein
LGGVGEVQASDGGDLEPAGLDAAMAGVAGAVGDGDLVPRQGDELPVEGGLVVLDDQQPGGMLAARTGPGASAAHSPIAASDLAPASTAATATPSTPTSRCGPPQVTEVRVDQVD